MYHIGVAGCRAMSGLSARPGPLSGRAGSARAEAEAGAPSFGTMPKNRDPSREAIAQAVASRERNGSREVAKSLFEFFEGDISHTVSCADDHALPPG